MTKKPELSTESLLITGLKTIFTKVLARFCVFLGLCAGSLSLISCTSILEPCTCSSPPLSELNGAWELVRWHLPPENGQVRLRNIPHGDNGAPLKLNFDMANHRLSGYSGCNNFTAGVQDDPKGIVIGPVASTRKMCLENRLNEIEHDFYYQLKDYRSLKKENDQLLLIGRDGAVLAFKKR